MSAHRFHPDPRLDDPPEAILFDLCKRCAQHSADPNGLDDYTLAALVDRVNADDQTATEATALGHIGRAAHLTARVAAT